MILRKDLEVGTENARASTAQNEDRLRFFIWLAPIVIIQIFLSLSVILIWFGPWPWPLTHPARLFGYLVIAQTSICIGYLRGKRALNYTLSASFRANLRENQSIRFAKWSVLLSLIMLIPTSYVRTGNFIPNVFTAISQSGYVYNEAFDLTNAISGKFYIEYIRIFISSFLISAIPLTVLYWRKYDIFWKIVSSLNAVGVVAIYIGAGQNKGLADFIAIVPWFMIAGWYLFGRVGRTFLINRLALVVAMGFVVAFFVSFFSIGQQQREGGVGVNGVFFDGRSYIYADSGVLGEELSDDNRIAYESFTRYLTSGYYALDLSFNLDKKFTFGLGNSMFIARNADALGGFDFFTSNSIPGRLETEFGYSQFRLWHSIYSWIASDIGYLGAIFMMGMFGYLLSRYWALTLLTGDHTYAALSYILFMLFYYVPCNNQVLQSGEYCVGFFTLLLMGTIKSNQKQFAN